MEPDSILNSKVKKPLDYINAPALLTNKFENTNDDNYWILIKKILQGPWLAKD